MFILWSGNLSSRQHHTLFDSGCLLSKNLASEQNSKNVLPSLATKTFAVLVAAITISGCVALPPATLASVPELTSKSDGIVVLKATPLQWVSLMATKWSTLSLKNQKTGQVVTLRDRAPRGVRYSLFTSAVPAGRYQLAGFGADGVAPATFGVIGAIAIQAMTSAGQDSTQAGVFTVESGGLTNLGMVLTAGGDKPGTAVVHDKAALQSNFEDFEPASRERMAAMPSHGWDGAWDPAESRRAAEALVRVGATRIVSDFSPDGRILIGSVLGQVHERLPSGQWRILQAGVTDAITAVRGVEGGVTFAATDDGRYYAFDASGNVSLQAKLPTGYVVQLIEPVAGGAAVLAQKVRPAADGATTKFNRVFVLQDGQGFDTARELSPVPQPADGQWFPGMAYMNGQLLVWSNSSGISRTGDLYRADLRTFQVAQEKTPFWGRTFYRPTPKFLVRERMNGTDVYEDFSRDDGATWSVNENAAPLWGAYFLDERKGWGLERVSTNWSSASAKLVLTENSGRHWELAGKPIEVTRGTARLGQVGDRLVIHTGDAVMSTTDRGSSWQMEWPRLQ